MRHAADNRLHFSELKAFARSAAHYKHACETRREVTRAMIVGSVGDAMVFGTPDRVALYDGPTRRGKEFESFATANKGRTICIQSEYDEAKASAQAILRDPVAGPILAQCEFQLVVQWEQDGVPCASGLHGERGGIDALNRSSGWLWDVKVTADAAPRALQRHAWRMWWHAQLAWMLDGYNTVHPLAPLLRAGLICVEASEPHNVTVMSASQETLDEGRKSIRKWLEQYKACEAADAWPPYAQDVIEFDVPEWIGGEDDA